MADKGDISFTFDAEGFNKAMQMVSTGMTNMAQASEKASAESSSKIAKGVTKGMINFSVIGTLFKGLIGTINQFVPEIGQTFEISKNIIARNLLNPLRMELVPILQKVLNWVRDNRLLFAQLGSVLVNVFRVIKTLAETVFSLVQPIIEVFKNTIQGIFGGTVRSMSDTINLLLFKITAFVMYLGAMLKPFFEDLAVFIKIIVDNVKGFFKGIGDSLAGFKFESLGKLVNLFGSLKDFALVLAPAMKSVAEIMGNVVGTAIKGLITIVDILVDSLTFLFNILSGKDIGKEWNNLSGNVQNSIKNLTSSGQPSTKVNDAIITKDGKVIHTDPQDNIIATKNLSGAGGRSVNLSMNFGNFNFTVTEGNARNAGANFANGLQGQIKNILLDNLVMAGGQ